MPDPSAEPPTEVPRAPAPEPGSHCSACGAAYPPGVDWPRRCAVCGTTAYRNPLPVAVVLLPVRHGRGGDPGHNRTADGASGTESSRARHGRTGLLVIRRAIEPSRGRLALPGGFIDHAEDWRDAVVRELREETRVSADPAEVGLADVLSSPGGHLLVFGLLPERRAEELPPPEPTEETDGWELLTAPADLGFPLHTRAAGAWFAGRYDR